MLDELIFEDQKQKFKRKYEKRIKYYNKKMKEKTDKIFNLEQNLNEISEKLKNLQQRLTGKVENLDKNRTNRLNLENEINDSQKLIPSNKKTEKIEKPQKPEKAVFNNENFDQLLNYLDDTLSLVEEKENISSFDKNKTLSFPKTNKTSFDVSFDISFNDHIDSSLSEKKNNSIFFNFTSPLQKSTNRHLTRQKK